MAFTGGATMKCYDYRDLIPLLQYLIDNQFLQDKFTTQIFLDIINNEKVKYLKQFHELIDCILQDSDVCINAMLKHTAFHMKNVCMCKEEGKFKVIDENEKLWWTDL